MVLKVAVRALAVTSAQGNDNTTTHRPTPTQLLYISHWIGLYLQSRQVIALIMKLVVFVAVLVVSVVAMPDGGHPHQQRGSGGHPHQQGGSGGYGGSYAPATGFNTFNLYPAGGYGDAGGAGGYGSYR
ncbi:hypothetical protein Pmani_029270 [Petrolisthes manimaculis]|uniref:Uncharacterized protein n=1 Tax=Petrolisthes manimaculis TaxID=1843537 RepID=A0AAE1NXX3_9EUCA|nr:hypothetical protein Pmani_029270 [Petrolisthes manimaculis]